MGQTEVPDEAAAKGAPTVDTPPRAVLNEDGEAMCSVTGCPRKAERYAVLCEPHRTGSA